MDTSKLSQGAVNVEPLPQQWTVKDEEQALIEEEKNADQEWWGGAGSLAREERRDLLDYMRSLIPSDKDDNKLAERIMYTVACLSVALVAGMMMSTDLRSVMPWWFSITLPLVLIARYLQYRERKHHYFILDFCYFANGFVVVYMVFMPDSPYFLGIMHALANGPLAWAIVLYRNSLVFHSLDRLCSLFIHFAPMCCLYVIRWYPEDASVHWPFGDFVPDKPPDESWTPGLEPEWLGQALILTLGATAAYEAWQLFYAFLIMVVFRAPCFHLHDDTSRLTLYRYSMQEKGCIYKFISVCGEGDVPTIVLWVLVNMLFTMGVTLPAVLWYRYQLANVLFVIFIYINASWNGGGFYVFAHAKIQRRRQERIRQAKMAPIGEASA